jgi:hypothetical protein
VSKRWQFVWDATANQENLAVCRHKKVYAALDVSNSIAEVCIQSLWSGLESCEKKIERARRKRKRELPSYLTRPFFFDGKLCQTAL